MGVQVIRIIQKSQKKASLRQTICSVLRSADGCFWLWNFWLSCSIAWCSQGSAYLRGSFSVQSLLSVLWSLQTFLTPKFGLYPPLNALGWIANTHTALSITDIHHWLELNPPHTRIDPWAHSEALCSGQLQPVQSCRHPSVGADAHPKKKCFYRND